MTPIVRVAVSVFRESVRDRVLYSLVLFAVLLIGVSYLIGQLTAGQDIKIIKDFGLAAISIIGLLIAVFIGVGLVWKEVERRSIYSVLSKPVRRYEFVLGKYFGLALTLLVNVAVMTASYYAVLAYMATTFPPEVRAAWPAPAADPALLGCGGPHPDGAAAGHGRRAVPVHVLEPARWRPCSPSGVWVIGTLQHRSAQFPAGRRFAGGGVDGAMDLLPAAELLRVRHQDAGRARAGRALVLCWR